MNQRELEGGYVTFGWVKNGGYKRYSEGGRVPHAFQAKRSTSVPQAFHKRSKNKN